MSLNCGNCLYTRDDGEIVRCTCQPPGAAQAGVWYQPKVTAEDYCDQHSALAKNIQLRDQVALLTVVAGAVVGLVGNSTIYRGDYYTMPATSGTKWGQTVGARRKIIAIKDDPDDAVAADWAIW